MANRDEKTLPKNGPAIAYAARAEHLEQGFVGTRVDETPDENYTVAGVIAGASVPPIHPKPRAASRNQH